MCGRFTLRTPLTVLAEQFSFDLGPLLPGFEPRFNIAPTQDVATVRVSRPVGPRHLAMLHWGLIPIWAKDKKIAYSTINARADTVATKPAFRSAFKRRRCLVLADGYFEWEKAGKAKLPWLYEVEGGKPFALAGLWESWRGSDRGDGAPLESCSLITTDANKLAEKVHDRMPAILDPADYVAWLDPENQDAEELQRLLEPFDPGHMTAKPVSTFVNTARNQGPECVEPREE